MEKTQIISIRNQTGAMATGPADIQMIIRKYYQQFYTYKVCNLGEMDHFLKKYKLP